MKYDLVIFDLDGTILDTLSDLAAACNEALRQNGYPERSREEVRTFVGNGVARLIQLAVPSGTPEDAVQRTLDSFRTYYAKHSNDTTHPYPGIPALMKALRDHGARVAVNSNKPDAAVQPLCAHHFPGLYDAALGEREDIPRKPSPEGARRLMARFGIDPARTLYVGDSQVDLLTAQNAGIDCAWAAWGFRRADELDGLSAPHAFQNTEELKTFIFE